MRITLPTILTLIRIALIPVIVVTFYLPFKGANIVAAVVFALGALTDWLDGWIARKYNLTSALGAFLDPVADKLTVTITLFLLVQADPSILMAVVCSIIVGREITISALREWMAEIGERKRVRVALLGKVKTIVQMVAIIVLLARLPQANLDLPVYEFGQALLIIAAVLTIWSGAAYVKAAWPILRGRES